MRPNQTRLAARPVLGRACNRSRNWALLGLLLALLTLSACTLEPRLETSADHLNGAPYGADTMALRNAGGGLLHWEFRSDNPHVTLRNQFGQALTAGALGAGQSVRLFIVVQGRVADPEVSLNARLHIDSNGGSRTIEYAAGAAATCPALPPATAAGTSARPVPVGNEILVSYTLPEASLGTAAAEARSVAAMHALRQLSTEYGLTALSGARGAGPDVLVAPPGADMEALISALGSDPRVSAVQRNYYLDLQWNGGAPADPYFGAQWALSSFGVPEAWAALTSAPQRDVVLAVLDTGVDGAHPDLAAKLLPGYDFYRNTSVTTPAWVEPHRQTYGRVAHGTHVAGIAAALGDDVGVIGVAFAPQVRLLPVKLFDDCGLVGRVDTLVKAVRWAAGLPVAGAPPNPNKAHVINLSVGIAGEQPVLEAAIAEAWRAGVLLVAAAGNHGARGGTAVLSPARAPEVLAVGSVDQDRSRSSFSNYGPELNLMAPGGFPQEGSPAEGPCSASVSTSIISTVPHRPGGTVEEGYGCFAGTSMAAPFVAGVAAMLFAQDATLTAEDVRHRLLSTALLEPHMQGELAEEYGAGLVCADAAVGAATRCGAP